MRRGAMLAVLFGTLSIAALADPQAAAQAPAKTPTEPHAKEPSHKSGFSLPTIDTAKPWTGDLDGMITRRTIRILVPYSRTYYFVDRGVQHGLAYEVSQLAEADLNKTLKTGHIRVHVVCIPVARDAMMSYLLEGRGDVAVGNLTITPERLKRVDFTNPTARNVSEIVVSGPGADPIGTVEDLSGKEVYVRKSSSYYESIQGLNAELAKTRRAPVKVRLAPENLEAEDILEMLNACLARFEKSGQSRDILTRYLKSTRWAKGATSREEIKKFEQTVEIFRTYGSRYDLDYLLLMAQGYQESELNQNARSRVGAIGIMQVMPATGGDMRVGDITQIDPNIHAGTKFLRAMINEYYAKEPMDALDKGLFAFAAYNAGPGRVRQLRKLAAQRGLDPNVWFNNVELMAAEKIGRETVTYVSNIYKYYLAYQMVEEERADREKTKAAIKEDARK